MAKKQKPILGPDGFEAIKQKLASRATFLIGMLRTETAGLIDFEKAVELRDASQQLVTTLLHLKNIDTSIELSQREPRSSYYDLAECGIEE